MRAVEHHHQEVAVVDREHRITYGELHELAESYAEALVSLGVSRTDRVGILLARSAGAVAAFFGATLAGAIAVPVDERLKPAQVAHVLADAGARAIVTDARHERLLRDVAHTPAMVLVSDTVWPARVVGSSGPTRTVAPAVREDLAALLYTSGSTGPPKGIMVTHENLGWGAAIVADYLGLTAKDRLITALPFSFDYGLNQVLSAVHVGGRVVVERSSHPAALCRTIEREGVTGFAGVPFLWQQLVSRHSPFLIRPFPSLRYVTNSGGSINPATLARLRSEKPHVRVFLMYGLTEAFRSTYLDPDEVDRRPTSIGTPIPNVDILVLGEDGRPCAPGTPGELVHRGPTVAAGYWNDPEATARTFRRSQLWAGESETVVFSGDLVQRDDDGYLYFVGRRDALFKSRGIRVNPEEIEDALRQCTAVLDVVAFASVSLNPGEEPSIVAAVVPSEDPDARAQVDLFCRSEIPAHMRPARLEIVSEIPRTPHGKPDRGLACQLWGRQAPPDAECT